MKVEVNIKNDEKILLSLVKSVDYDEYDYILCDDNNNLFIGLKDSNSQFEPRIINDEVIEDANLQAVLDQLYIKVIEKQQSGTEYTDNDGDFDTDQDISPYNPDEIKVSEKTFSLRLIKDMINEGDLDMNPDFQRNYVWNNAQKSRLIESILLRIPLPMFYFSEDSDGRLAIIDGLQRLTTINDFMNNKFQLTNLEYLGDACNGCYYKDDSDKKRRGLDAKYYRWFNLTQISGNVIDPSSPPKVKYDIFRRINTGGKPLNNQEIRNCLSGKALRFTLRKMAELPSFKEATDNSIKPTRMNDQEVALRFILFQRLYQEDPSLDNYNGYMESVLDKITDDLSKAKESELSIFVESFDKAMLNASYLFGNKYAFRKVNNDDIKPDAGKQLINKALFVSWSVLLSQYDVDDVRINNLEGALLTPLAEEITSNRDFFNYLSFGTNGKANIQYAFNKATEILSEHITK